MENAAISEIGPDLVVRIINTIGPPPKLEHGPDHDAVFDPFEFEGQDFFLHYMATIYCWMLRRPLPVTSRQEPVASDNDDNFEDAEIFEALRFMPPPALPSQPLPAPVDGIPSMIFQGPFWYRGARFVWFFGDGADDWQLANCAEPAVEAA